MGKAPLVGKTDVTRNGFTCSEDGFKKALELGSAGEALYTKDCGGKGKPQKAEKDQGYLETAAKFWKQVFFGS